jgi:hypothetical protein
VEFAFVLLYGFMVKCLIKQRDKFASDFVVILSCSMIAAVGLVESNAVNIVAAMLVSPLMV